MAMNTAAAIATPTIAPMGRDAWVDRDDTGIEGAVDAASALEPDTGAAEVEVEKDVGAELGSSTAI